MAILIGKSDNSYLRLMDNNEVLQSLTIPENIGARCKLLLIISWLS